MRILVPTVLLAISLLGQQSAFQRNAKTTVVEPGSTAQLRLSLSLAKTLRIAILQVGVEDAAAAISVQLPDGSVLTAENAASKRAMWMPTDNPAVGGLFPCPNARRWIAIIVEQSGPVAEYVVEASSRKGGSLCASFLDDNLGQPGVDYFPMGSAVRTDREQYQVGDDVRISVPVRNSNGSAVRNATVEAAFRVRDGNEPKEEVGRVRLTDPDGDGLYSGTWRATRDAYMDVTATITGRIQRERGNIRVNPRHARLLSAEVVQQANRAQIVLKFQVYTAGHYEITASGPQVSDGTFYLDLEPGEHTIRGNERLWYGSPLAIQNVHVLMTNPNALYGRDLVGYWVRRGNGWGLK